MYYIFYYITSFSITTTTITVTTLIIQKRDREYALCRKMVTSYRSNLPEQNKHMEQRPKFLTSLEHFFL